MRSVSKRVVRIIHAWLPLLPETLNRADANDIVPINGAHTVIAFLYFLYMESEYEYWQALCSLMGETKDIL
jgi:hypothetical protein